MHSVREILTRVVKSSPKPSTGTRRVRKPRVDPVEAELAQLREAAMRKKIRCESEWLTTFTRWVVGDPRLSAWEVGFVDSIRFCAQRNIMLSPKQGAAVERIRTRLGYDASTIAIPPATPEEQVAAREDHDEDAVNLNVLGEASKAWEPPPLTRSQREHIDAYMFLADNPSYIRFGAG